MDAEEKRRRAMLGRLAGQTYAEIGKEIGTTRQMAKRYADQARGKYRLSVNVARIGGLPADATAQALRQYLDSLGLWHPDREDNA